MSNQIILTIIKSYSKIINNILDRYSYIKNKFYDKLSNIKPSIFRNHELFSIKDFVNLEKNKSINPKKIEINFIDGKINLSYKILGYELYEWWKIYQNYWFNK